MRGCRPLTDQEIAEILPDFYGRCFKRDKAMFLLGLKSGFRVSEVLSVLIGDVLQYGQLVDRVAVRRKDTKGKVEGRSVPLHPAAKAAIRELLDEMAAEGADLSPETPLFRSRKGENRPISRVQAWWVLKRAANRAKLPGKVATHSWRKSFAQRIYEKLDHDLVKTQRALGHRCITSTVSYLSFVDEEIDRAILSI